MSTEEDADLNRVSPAGRVYQAMVRELLSAEYDRRTKIESRGSTLVTASGSLLTVVFGLTVVVTGKDYRFDNCLAIVSLLAALLAFIISAVLGICVQAYGLPYDTVDRKTLNGLTEDEALWGLSADRAVREDVRQQVRTICSLRAANEIKAKWVTASLVFQVIAIILLSVSAGLELSGNVFEPPDISDWTADLP